MDLSKVEKYEDLSFSQWIALGNKFGGLGNVIRVLRGELDVNLEEVKNRFFDKNGRRITNGLKGTGCAFCDPNKDIYHVQPPFEHTQRLLYFHHALGLTHMTVEHFMEETERLLGLIRDDYEISNIIKGVHLPVVFPKMEINDIGQVIEQWLVGVKKNYQMIFKDREFFNILEGHLNNSIFLLPETRHGLLIERMKEGPIVGIYFPNAMQGFSIDAARRQMYDLPKSLILSGLDTIIGMIMYPDILARDNNVPRLDLSAFSHQGKPEVPFFVPEKVCLDFGSHGNLNGTSGHTSSGLLFLG